MSITTLDPETLTTFLVGQLNGSEAFINRVMSVFEEEHSQYRPHEGMMSVSQQVAHAADSIDWFLDGTFGPDGFDLDFETHAQRLVGVDSLEAERAKLAAAFDRARRTIGEKSHEELTARLPAGIVMSEKPRFAVVHGIEEHTAHHRGSLSVYARTMGLVPPMPYM